MTPHQVAAFRKVGRLLWVWAVLAIAAIAAIAYKGAWWSIVPIACSAPIVAATLAVLRWGPRQTPDVDEELEQP